MNNDSQIKLVIFDVDETVSRFIPAVIASEEDRERYKDSFFPVNDSDGLYFMPYQNVREELQALRDKGIKIGFCSNADQDVTLQKLRLVNILDHDDFVCCSSDGFKKPHPAPLLRIAEHFCVDPQNCLAVGNDHRDWIAAALAGMHVVVTNGGRAGQEIASTESWRLDDRDSFQYTGGEDSVTLKYQLVPSGYTTGPGITGINGILSQINDAPPESRIEIISTDESSQRFRKSLAARPEAGRLAAFDSNKLGM